jgi:hypothetical protein
MMKDCRQTLVMERKPTATGAQKVVGGEVYPVNLIGLVSANILWILLLAAPVVLSYVLARRGFKMPSEVRQVLRMVPVLVHAFT